MAEEIDVSQKTDDSQKKESKAYSKEQVDELVRKSVEGVTSKLNANFQKQFSEIKKEKEDVVMSSEKIEHDNKREIAEMRLESKREKLLNKSVKAYSQAGVELPDDEVLLDMIRVDSENPLRIVENDIARALKNAETIEAARLDERDKFAKAHGRTVQKAKGNGDLKTQDDFSDAELDAMSDEQFLKIQKNTINNGE